MKAFLTKTTEGLILSTIALTGCGGLRAPEVQAQAVTTEALAGGGPGVFFQSEPVNMGPVINTALRESEPSFTANGKTMYFNCQTRSGAAGNDVCVSHLTGRFEDGQWSTPEVVAPGVISTSTFLEAEPMISLDGMTLMFMSPNRPGGMGGNDIWFSMNVDGEWTTPENMGLPFNGPFHDHCLMFTGPDQNRAFWTSTRPGGYGGNDIWTSRKLGGVWSDPTNLGANVNTPFSEHHSWATPDGKSLFVTSNKPGGYGGEDIYITTEGDDGVWGPLVNLGPLVNTAQNDRCPSFTTNDQIVVFDSERLDGRGSKDMWWLYYDNIKDIR